MKKIWVILITCLLTTSAIAATDLYPFTSPQKQQLFTKLTNELRCLVCQNESLAASQAFLAKDLRRKIYNRIQQGESEQQIINYMVKRYGDFVLYKPPLNRFTYLLWLGPFIVLLIAFLILLLVIAVRKKQSDDIALTLAQQNKIKTLVGSSLDPFKG